MSTERAGPPPCRTLAEYVELLILDLGRREPAAVERIRKVVGDLRARIELDDEAVVVSFDAGRLRCEPAPDDAGADGLGRTDRATVLDLLDGHVEAGEAILQDRLTIRGEVDAVIRMFRAIEILLDGSSRVPALQRLADDFRRDPCREPPGPPGAPRGVTPWSSGADRRQVAERALLAKLGLLP